MRIARKKRFSDCSFKHFQLEEVGEVSDHVRRQVKHLMNWRMRCLVIQEKKML